MPVAFGFFFVYLFGVDIPFNDTKRMIPLFAKLASSTLTLSDLWSLHYEHRPFFPQIAMLLLGTATDFNNVAILYLIQVCLLITLVSVLLAFKGSVRSKLLLFAPIPFLVFSLGQHWNMVQAFSIHIVFVQTFGVLAFYLLYLLRYEGFKKLVLPAALISGTVASFSAAHGLLVWPVGFLQILILPIQSSAKKFLASAWGLVGLGVWVIYFVDYTEPTTSYQAESGLFNSSAPAANGITYFLTALGGSLFRQQAPALLTGLLLAFLSAISLFFTYRNRKLDESSFWIAILSFSFLILASTTVSRGGMGLENAVLSKYVTFSVLAVIGTYVLLLKSAFEQKVRVAAVSLGVLSALIVTSMPLSYIQGIESGERSKLVRERTAFMVVTYESQPKELLRESFGNLEQIKVLERLDYSVFSNPRQAGILPPPLSGLSSAASSTQSRIGSINGTPIRRQNQPIVISEEAAFVRITGWAVDDKAKDSAGGVYLEIDGKRFPAYYGTPTPSLAERFSIPSYQNSGFERTIPTSEIGAGTHNLSLVVLTTDGEEYYRPAQQATFHT